MKGRRLSLAGHMVSSMMHEFGFLSSQGYMNKLGKYSVVFMKRNFMWQII